MTHTELGQAGEELATELLRQKGYAILKRNYRFKKGEVDIICTNKEKLVFVEVKTRQTNAFGEPFIAVSRAKQRQIISVANQFIQENQLDMEVRFDVVSVVHNSYKTDIQHICSAFIPLV